MASAGLGNDEVIDQFLLMLTVSRGRAVTTIDSYANDLRGLSEAYPDLLSISSRDLETYFAGLRSAGRSAATVARSMSATRGLFQYLLDEGYVAVDPTNSLPVSTRGRSLPKALPESTIETLISSISGNDALSQRDRLLFEFLYGTGCRVSETTETNVHDVDLDEDLIRVTGKGSKQRLVPIGRHLRTALEAYIDGGARTSLLRGKRTARLLLNARGEPLSRHGVNEILHRRALAAGLDTKGVHAHAFRHSCATHMIAHGADIRVVQELLGHSSIATTQRYTGVALATLRDAYGNAHPRAAGVA